MLYQKAPTYEAVIEAGKDIRYLWFQLRDWRGGDSEDFFGDLGDWAEKRISELPASEKLLLRVEISRELSEDTFGPAEVT